MSAPDSGLPQTDLFSLKYGEESFAVERPKSYQAAVLEAQKCFPSLDDPSAHMLFQTSDLRDLRGEVNFLSEGVWAKGIKEISRLTIIAKRPVAVSNSHAEIAAVSDTGGRASPLRQNRKRKSKRIPTASSKRTRPSVIQRQPILESSATLPYEISSDSSQGSDTEAGPGPSSSRRVKREELKLPELTVGIVGPERVKLYRIKDLQEAIQRVGSIFGFEYSEVEVFINKFIVKDFGSIGNVKCSDKEINERITMLPRVERCLAAMKRDTDLKSMVPILGHLRVGPTVLDVRSVLIVLMFRRIRSIREAYLKERR